MALGRHVNHHFSTAAATPAPRPPTQPSPTKLIRKNGRKCRYRKKPWSGKLALVLALSQAVGENAFKHNVS